MNEGSIVCSLFEEGVDSKTIRNSKKMKETFLFHLSVQTDNEGNTFPLFLVLNLIFHFFFFQIYFEQRTLQKHPKLRIFEHNRIKKWSVIVHQIHISPPLFVNGYPQIVLSFCRSQNKVFDSLRNH